MQHWLLAGGVVAFVLLLRGEHGVLRVEWQGETVCRGAAPPWGAALPDPGGVPRRGKGRAPRRKSFYDAQYRSEAIRLVMAGLQAVDACVC